MTDDYEQESYAGSEQVSQPDDQVEFALRDVADRFATNARSRTRGKRIATSPQVDPVLDVSIWDPKC